jgi:DNA-binding HxlR family transcriptional regulator
VRAMGEPTRSTAACSAEADGAPTHSDAPVDCCCPHYHQAVELIGRRWSGAIVAVLLRDGPQRFSTIRERVPGVSDRLLSQRMRELETAGIVVRTVEPGSPVRVSYALTAKGGDLREVVDALERWGRRWVASEAAGEGSALGAPRAVSPEPII